MYVCVNVCTCIQQVTPNVNMLYIRTCVYLRVYNRYGVSTISRLLKKRVSFAK